MVLKSRLVKRRSHQRDTTVDCISSLPDAMLWNILSFVPTKTAVRTSILSKRWKYVWTGVPVLVFTEMPGEYGDDGCYLSLTPQQRAMFRSFVDRVLLHNEVSSVEYLHLTIDEDCYFYLKSWMIAIAKREIAHIDIRVMNWAEVVPVSLSANFFTSETLVDLELWGRFMVDVPWSLHLPNLEIAHLQQLKLPDDEFLKTLSSSCPKLEELSIVDCEGLTSTLHVESSTLKTLSVMWNMGKIESPHACIVIQAPNLETLHVEENLKGHVLFINGLTSLTDADIKIEQYTDIEHVFEFFRKLAGVKTLRLEQSDYDEEEARRLKFILSNLPIFKNLTCLKINFGEKLYLLLESAPMLKCLILERHALFEDFPFVSKPVPKCLSCLECVQFDDFKVTKGDMAMVAYFFKNAIVLKDAIIHMPSIITAELKAYVFQELLRLPRSSAACQVKVSARPTCRYI